MFGLKYRSAFHYIAGGISAWITTIFPLLGFSLILVFLVYEAMNDWRKGDDSYHDVLEGMIGIFTVATGLGIWHYFN